MYAIRSYYVDASAIEAIDTAGALLLVQLSRHCARQGVALSLSGLAPHQQALVDLVAQVPEPEPEPPQPAQGLLERLGRRTMGHVEQGIELLAFLGEVV